MLDEKDLQAIAMLIKSEIAESEKRMDKKLEVMKEEVVKETNHNMKVLLDTEVTAKFNLIAEDLRTLHEKVDDLIAINEERESESFDIAAMKAAIRQLNREVKALKKAN